MAKVIMELNGREYESLHEWNSLEEFHSACPLEGEFPTYVGDGSEGGSCHYSLWEEE